MASMAWQLMLLPLTSTVITGKVALKQLQLKVHSTSAPCHSMHRLTAEDCSRELPRDPCLTYPSAQTITGVRTVHAMSVLEPRLGAQAADEAANVAWRGVVRRGSGRALLDRRGRARGRCAVMCVTQNGFEGDSAGGGVKAEEEEVEAEAEQQEA